MNSYFPDVNAWIALAYRGHQHHEAAAAWFNDLEPGSTAYFCRITQLGFLRLLCHPAVMKDEVKGQSEAWRQFDMFLADRRCAFQPEPGDPSDLTVALRRMTSSQRPSANQWPDAYIAAFAQVAGLTLVTFDRALYKMAADWCLLLR